jgi:hypothetical protein
MGKEDEDTTGAGGTDADDKGGSDDTKPTGDQKPDAKTDDTSPDTDWEKRFKGLQPKHQTLVEDHKSALVQHGLDTETWGKEKVELGLKIDTLESELKAITEKMEGFEKSNEELSGLVESGKAKLERNALIMSEYPELAVMEAKGLIRDDLEGDSLTEALNDLRSLMVAKGEEAVKDKTAGSTGDDGHSSGGRGQAMSAADLNQKIMDAQKNRDFAEADRLTQLLIKEANATILSDS